MSTNKTIKLDYGMKLIIPVNPIQYVIGIGIGVSSCNDDTVDKLYIVGKYWDNDTDPMRYKVKCTPINDDGSIDMSGKFGYEKFYSSDLVSLINRGTIKIVE